MSCARIFKTHSFNYFIKDSVLQIDYKIIKRVGFKNPSARPSRDTFIEHISSLELSVKLKSELRKLHADFGSGLIGLCHNTNKVQINPFLAGIAGAH